MGGIAFIVDFSLLYALTEYLNLHYLTSATISFVAGLFVNYLLSKIWVFSDSKFSSKKVEFVLFAVIGVVGLAINDLMIWIFSDLLCLWYMLSKVIATVVTYLWNFFARKYLVFSK